MVIVASRPGSAFDGAVTIGAITSRVITVAQPSQASPAIHAPMATSAIGPGTSSSITWPAAMSSSASSRGPSKSAA